MWQPGALRSNRIMLGGFIVTKFHLDLIRARVDNAGRFRDYTQPDVGRSLKGLRGYNDRPAGVCPRPFGLFDLVLREATVLFILGAQYYSPSLLIRMKIAPCRG
jgi:hypothetical protein